jgi:benzylsuccinate CoA-transferase BbsF subunit
LSDGSTGTHRALAGVKVIDFTWAAVGPITVKTLSDYGADVIKLEGRTRPSSMRVTGPFKNDIVGLNRSGSFNAWETGKKSVAINLAMPDGVALAKRFVAWADVVVESMAGGTMKRMGLGYEALRQVKPDIIMLSTCMMGQTGPYSAHPGIGHQLTALCGFNHISGWPGQMPAALGHYTDFIAPRFAALAILGALDYRRRTGKGQYLDLSQYENGLQFMSPLILDYGVNNRIADRQGNRVPDAAPHGAFPCAGEDRWCVIGVFTEEEWQAFCRVTGLAALACDPRFATLEARKRNEDELERLLSDWTLRRTPEEVMTLLQEAGVPAGVVATGQDLQDRDPQLRHRHFNWILEHPEVGAYHSTRPGPLLSRSECELRRAPLLGEHNEYALKTVLGMSDDEIAELVVKGVIE